MTWTQHGHHIPTSPTDDEQGKRPPIARCGGTHLCKKCKADFAAYLERKDQATVELEEFKFDKLTTFRPANSEIQAVQVTAENVESLAEQFGGEVSEPSYSKPLGVVIPTMVAPEFVAVGNYIIKQGARLSGMAAGKFESAYIHRPDLEHEDRSVTATTQDTQNVIKGSYDDIADHIRRAGTSGNYERSADTGPNGSWPPGYVPSKPKLGE